MNGLPRNAYTDAIAWLFLAVQMQEGNWYSTESRRPPMGSGDFQATALAIFTLRHYAPVGHASAADEAIARGVAWLSRAQPETTQDRAFHLLGLTWGGAKPKAAAVRALAALQRRDGGWSRLSGMESDAYATGQVLYALHLTSQMNASDRVYQRGVDFLLRTQADDGTWHVKTRAIWLQPYFESGFPYGKDQFISTAGTAWAAMALATGQSRALAKR